MHTLDLDEHKEQDRENARRILAKEFVWMTLSMYIKTEYSTFSKLYLKEYIYGLSYYI